jgi:hypothetical protein
LEKIAELEKKLQTLIANRKSLKQKLEMRKKQFHLLVQCVHQLQDSLLHGTGDIEEWRDEGDSVNEGFAGTECMELDEIP